MVRVMYVGAYGYNKKRPATAVEYNGRGSNKNKKFLKIEYKFGKSSVVEVYRLLSQRGFDKYLPCTPIKGIRRVAVKVPYVTKAGKKGFGFEIYYHTSPVGGLTPYNLYSDDSACWQYEASFIVKSQIKK